MELKKDLKETDFPVDSDMKLQKVIWMNKLGTWPGCSKPD